VTREVFVLSRKEGVDDLFWDRLDRHKNTTLGDEFGQQAAIPGMNAGHDSRLVMRELLVVRQLVVELCDRDADDNTTGDRQEDHAAEDLSYRACKDWQYPDVPKPTQHPIFHEQNRHSLLKLGWF